MYLNVKLLELDWPVVARQILQVQKRPLLTLGQNTDLEITCIEKGEILKSLVGIRDSSLDIC